jgi:UDP-GlcNAc:undecaprenyl-phosphate GlcNAc-1-phosphate transferase
VLLLTGVFIVAVAVALAGGGVMRGVAMRLGAVVPPRPDRWHAAPTPTMGGVAIAAAVLVAFGLAALFPGVLGPVEEWSPVVLAAFAMFVVGVLDDRLQLSPVAKLVASLAIGAFLVFALAASVPGAGISTPLTLCAIVWFAGVCHAVNLLDNMDGLATGVVLVAALGLAGVFGVLGGELGLLLMAVLLALAGALLGFLYWNRPKARLFMGDAGSLFIGAVVGGVSLVPILRGGPAMFEHWALAGLVLVVPLFDTAFVLVLRRLAGRSATRGGTDHVSHRLVSLGFSERRAVRLLYALGAVGALIAGALRAGGLGLMLAVTPLFAVVVILLGIYLARVPAYNAEDFQALQKSSFAPFLKDLMFRWHAGEVLLDLILIPASYYLAYRLRFEGAAVDANLQYFTASLPVVLGAKLAALYASGLYQRSWTTFELRDVAVVLRGVVAGSVLAVIAVSFLFRFQGFSRVLFLLDAVLLTVAVVATRASFQAMTLMVSTRSKRSRRIVVYGAGAFGRLLVREMRANEHWRMNPVAFIDDDPLKQHRWIVGVPVRGRIDALEDVLRRHAVDEVILSTPKVNGAVEQRIRDVCAALERPVRRFQMEIR